MQFILFFYCGPWHSPTCSTKTLLPAHFWMSRFVLFKQNKNTQNTYWNICKNVTPEKLTTAFEQPTTRVQDYNNPGFVFITKHLSFFLCALLLTANLWKKKKPTLLLYLFANATQCNVNSLRLHFPPDAANSADESLISHQAACIPPAPSHSCTQSVHR